MIRNVLPLVLFLTMSTAMVAQSVFWRDVSVNPDMGRTTDGTVTIENYRAVSVDMSAFKAMLAGAPDEGSSGSRNSLEISFPLPDGGQETFLVIRSSLMMPRLAAKYPNIQILSHMFLIGF